MVDLDGGRGPVGLAAAFDHVGIERTLGQEARAGDRPGLVAEDVDEDVADSPPLFLRVDHATQGLEKSVGRIDHAELGLGARAERRATDARSPCRKQPRIDEHADHPRPESPGEQAAQTAESTPPDNPQTTRCVGPDPAVDLGQGSLDERLHGPGSRIPADPVQEVAQDQRAVGRVRDLGMKLEPVDRQLVMPHRRDRAGRGRGQGQKTGPGVVELIAMAHPDGRFLRDVAKERLGRIQHMTLGAAELACRRRVDLAPQHLAGQLHPVADPQDRQPQLEDRRIALRRPGFVNTRRPARENQGERVQLANPLGRDVMADDPRKRMTLANPASNELHILSTEIKDQYGSRRRVGIRHELLSENLRTCRYRSKNTYRFVHQILSNRRRTAQLTNMARKDMSRASSLCLGRGLAGSAWPVPPVRPIGERRPRRRQSAPTHAGSFESMEPGDRRAAGRSHLVLEHAGCSPVSRTIRAAPSTVCDARSVATSRGNPARTPPSDSASIMR